MKFIYRFLIKAIYQRWISPRKGYRCAHSVRHGGPGCSGAVLTILERDGLLRGWSAIRGRFKACRSAYDLIISEREAEEKKKEKDKKRGGNDWGSNCCSADGACTAGHECLPSSRACKTCDINPCDGDIGGCDLPAGPC